MKGTRKKILYPQKNENILSIKGGVTRMCTKKQSYRPIDKDLVLSICCFVSPYESHSTSLLSERRFQRGRSPAPRAGGAGARGLQGPRTPNPGSVQALLGDPRPLPKHPQRASPLFTHSTNTRSISGAPRASEHQFGPHFAGALCPPHE